MSTGRPRDVRQLVLHGEEREAHPRARLELDEHVHVAFGREVVSQHGAEQGEASDAVAPAESGDPVHGDLDPGIHGRTPANVRVLKTGSTLVTDLLVTA